MEEAILYIEELQRQLKDRLEETLEEEERQHWEEMEEVVELDKVVDKVDKVDKEQAGYTYNLDLPVRSTDTRTW